MINCSKDIVAYHNTKVKLPNSKVSAMETRQASIRSQLEKGLRRSGLPKPWMEVQGSFAMRTMILSDKNDYDIDDGAYFDAEELKKANGGKTMGPKLARKRVQGALTYSNPSTKCEARSKCVRIQYQKGCHIDIPVYRRVRNAGSHGSRFNIEIAINKDWKKSDARDVTKWFESENKKRSPDTSNGGQMCRIVRLMKKYSKSRKKWKHKMLGGFAITVLVVECYQPNAKREDKALYDTMTAIQIRLKQNRAIKNPVARGRKIIDDRNDEKAKFLLKNLKIAIKELHPLLSPKCTRPKALKCWGRVFNAEFFGNRN